MKKVKKDAMNSKSMIDLILSEINVLQRTEHINLMKVVEIMEDKVYFYLVCELVEGGDLQQRLDEVGTFNEEQAS